MAADFKWKTICLALAVFWPTGVWAALGDEVPEPIRAEIEREFQWLRAEAAVPFVVTASRVKEKVGETVPSVTVIPREQFRRMGARHLMDVIRAVPGMTARYVVTGQYYSLETRGIEKQYSQDVLILLDGHPLNSNLLGSATWTLDNLILDNVEQIEVIRGPGSVLYGANAFSAVINVITRKPGEIEGAELTAGGGSHDTERYNLLWGRTFGADVGLSCNLNYYHTDGYGAYLESDYQTRLDALFGTNASQAPGEARNSDQKTDLSLRLQKGGWSLDGRYIDRGKDAGPALGRSLNRRSHTESVDYSLVLGYGTALWDHLDVKGKLYRNHNDLDNILQLVPDGGAAMSPEGVPVVLPQGLIGRPEATNERTGGEVQLTWRPAPAHTLVAGLSYEEMDQDDVRYRANFLYTPMPGVVVPLPRMTDLSDEQNYNREVSRTFRALFLQELWNLTPRLRVSAGARYDDYSDFGGSFNPRLGLRWEYLPDYDVKLLYGRAFRAPSFYELYSMNNPSLMGNPDLEPETIDTYELSLGGRFSPTFQARVTGFHNTVQDDIGPRLVGLQDHLMNRGELRTYGIESRFRLDIAEGTYLSAHYTWQKAESSESGKVIWNIPRQKGTLMANHQIKPWLNLYADLHFQAGFKRQEGDTRPDIDDFGVVNLCLLASDLWPALHNPEVRIAVYNLLDEEYRYPISKETIPDDHPMPGIQFMAELRYRF